MSQFSNNQRIGEILQTANLVSPAQIEVALKDQQRYQDLNLGELKIGEILALRGWLKQETADFFVTRWSHLLNERARKPLGYYLCEASLLSEQQIYYLLQEQKKLPIKLKLGELAYLEGWLNLKTVDYFVKNLATISTNSGLNQTTFSLSLEHNIIKQYTKGKTNFKNLKLNQAYLKNATLRGTNFNNAEFVKAFLQGINWNYSSLKAVNLSQANLAQASLKKTDLREANLYQANLRKAFLESANLQKANLREADLKQACLIRASLEGADLKGANLQGTLLYGACYDEKTSFDTYFNPLQEGMRFTGKKFDSSQILLL